MSKAKVFTRDFLLVFLSAGLIRICYQLQNTVTPLYADQLGFSAAAIGALTTICTVASLALRPLIGVWLDRYSRRIIAFVGTALFAVATLLGGWAATLPALIFIKVFQGAGFSVHTTAVNTVATDILPPERLSDGIGYMGLTGSLSQAIAPALAMSFAVAGAYRGAYVAAFAAGLIATGCLLLFRRSGNANQPVVQAEPAKGLARCFERGAIRPSVIMLLLGLCAAAPGTFMALFAMERGMSAEQISLYFTINAVALALARLFGTKASRRMGLRLTALVTMAMNACSFVLVAAAHSAWLLWAAAALYGLGYGTVYPLLNAAAITSAPPHRRGTAMATFLTAMDIGVGFGASLWGLLVDRAGMDALFPVCAVVSLFTYLAYLLLFRNRAAD